MEAQRPGDVLVIENDVQSLTRISSILRNASHNVVSCTTLAEGRQHLERLPFDVVVCAQSLADGESAELCARIKNSPDLQQTSCIVLMDVSQDGEDSLIDAAFKRGYFPPVDADDFLPRDASPAALTLSVMNMIRMRRYLDESSRAVHALMGTAEGAEEQNAHYKGHCKRLANMAVELGMLMGCDEWDMGVLEKAGYLHDIGLICIPGAILEKLQPLSPREKQIIRQHCELGEKLCRPVAALRPVLPVIRHHHERLDGSGYPDGLQGKDVPFLAQVFAIVDVYESMRLWRPYRSPLNEEQAIKVLASEVSRGLWNREIFETFRDKVLPGLDARLTAAQIYWPSGGASASAIHTGVI